MKYYILPHQFGSKLLNSYAVKHVELVYSMYFMLKVISVESPILADLRYELCLPRVSLVLPEMTCFWPWLENVCVYTQCKIIVKYGCNKTIKYAFNCICIIIKFNVSPF